MQEQYINHLASLEVDFARIKSEASELIVDSTEWLFNLATKAVIISEIEQVKLQLSKMEQQSVDVYPETRGGPVKRRRKGNDDDDNPESDEERTEKKTKFGDESWEKINEEHLQKSFQGDDSMDCTHYVIPENQLRNHLDDLDWCEDRLANYISPEFNSAPKLVPGILLYHGGSTEPLDHPELGFWFFLTVYKEDALYYARGESDITCYRWLGGDEVLLFNAEWSEIACLYGFDTEEFDGEHFAPTSAFKRAEFKAERLLEKCGYDGRTSGFNSEIGLPPKSFHLIEKVNCLITPEFIDRSKEVIDFGQKLTAFLANPEAFQITKEDKKSLRANGGVSATEALFFEIKFRVPNVDEASGTVSIDGYYDDHTLFITDFEASPRRQMYGTKAFEALLDAFEKPDVEDRLDEPERSIRLTDYVRRGAPAFWKKFNYLN
jgi:hypothetical protein